jgi:hypothetical protein
MNAIPLTPLTLDLARRIIWFEPPDHALADPIRFMAYAMTYARHEDMRIIRGFISDDDMREALDRAPPGIIDPRSWAYWNSKMGIRRRHRQCDSLRCALGRKIRPQRRTPGQRRN